VRLCYIFFLEQMLNSRGVRHKITLDVLSIAILQTILSVAKSPLAEFVDPNCPWVPSKIPGKWLLICLICSVIMTWAWYAPQNATMLTWNVYQPTVHLTVLRSVIGLLVTVVRVSMHHTIYSLLIEPSAINYFNFALRKAFY